MVGRSSGSASVHIVAMSRIASTASASTLLQFSSTISSRWWPSPSVFSCKCTYKVSHHQDFHGRCDDDWWKNKEIRVFDHPANNVQSSSNEGWICRPFPCHQLQQEHTEGVYIWLLCCTSILQVLWNTGVLLFVKQTNGWLQLAWYKLWHQIQSLFTLCTKKKKKRILHSLT